MLLLALMMLPHLVWLTLWDVAARAMLLVHWLATLFSRRTEEDLATFLIRYLRYRAHVQAYLASLAGRYPGFRGRAGSYPIDFDFVVPQRQRALLTLFRAPLAVPAFILSSVFGVIFVTTGVASWLVALALGRQPKGMRDLAAYCLRYRVQTSAYLFVVTTRYPVLASDARLYTAPAVEPQTPQ